MKIKPQDRAEAIGEALEKGLSVLYYDIETSPMEVYTHYIGNKVSINPAQIKTPSKVISIQYMFEGQKKAKFLEWDNGDDDTMLRDFIDDVWSKADIVITQNGDAFDHKVLNHRASLLRLEGFDRKPSIDILKCSRSSFRLASHKLDWRSRQQGLGGKKSMCFQDWIDIVEGRVAVGKRMGPYGCKDVEDTRRIFLSELRYYNRLPVDVEKVIMGLVDPKVPRNVTECIHCGSYNTWRHSIRRAKRRFECRECGKWFSTKIDNNSTDAGG